MSSGSTPRGVAWPTSPSTASSPCSTAARSRPAWRSATATPITVVKDMGLVTTVFDERTLSGLRGHLAIGHTRYSTHGSSDWTNAQPVYRPVGRAGFALGHNGNLTNTAALAEKAGMLPGPDRHRQRPGGRAPGPGLPARRPRTAGRRGDLEQALRRCSRSSRAPSPSSCMTPTGSSACATPTASARCASGGSGRPTSPRGLGAGLRVAGARRHRRHLRPRARARRDGGHRRRRVRSSLAVPWPRERRPAALHLRVRLLRPARQPPLRQRGPRGPPPHGRAAGRPRRRSRPTW